MSLKHYTRSLNSIGYLSNVAIAEDIKFIMKITDDLQIIEVNTIKYTTAYAPKFIVNDKYRIGLNWLKYFDETKLGVYDNEHDMMLDVRDFYNWKAKLVAQYKHKYEKSKDVLARLDEKLKGREEYLI